MIKKRAPSAFPSLGPLERQVLEVLWARGSGSVGDVLEQFPRKAEYAYTTIMTVLVRLHEKGIVTRDREGRAYRYRPMLTREEFLASASAALIRGFTENYGGAAAVHFADAITRLPRRQRDQLRRRLEELLDEPD